MVAHGCSASTWEAEAGTSQGQGQPGLPSQFQSSLSCTGRHFLRQADKQGEGNARSFCALNMGCGPAMKHLSFMASPHPEGEDWGEVILTGLVVQPLPMWWQDR